jgi:hypothetical protein
MEHLSLGMEQQNQQEEQSIQWRRDKVLELSSQGHEVIVIEKCKYLTIRTNKQLLVE